MKHLKKYNESNSNIKKVNPTSISLKYFDINALLDGLESERPGIKSRLKKWISEYHDLNNINDINDMNDTNDEKTFKELLDQARNNICFNNNENDENFEECCDEFDKCCNIDDDCSNVD